MTYLENADFFVRIVNLPYGIGAQTVTNEDGTFSMYLSARSGFEKQIDDYMHECEHIENDDFFNDKPINEVERRN